MNEGAEQQPKTIYRVKIIFFAGMEMEGIYKGHGINDILKHPDIAGKLAVTDSIQIDRMGIDHE